MLVKDRMTSNPTYVKPDHTLAAAKAVMDAEDIRHVPVVDGEKLVGIITTTDMLGALLDVLQATRRIMAND